MTDPALLAEAIRVLRGTSCVVSGVDLRAERGEVLAILGPNGAGKSSLLRAVAGLVPREGRVYLNGTDAATLDARERARRLAFVPQHSALRSALPVYEVVAQGRYLHRSGFALGERDRSVIAHVLEVCNLTSFAERTFTTLSAGEQRRVLIARALATEARILCLDEPTASLDVQHVLRLYALLRRLASEGYAVVTVLHPLDDALRFADRALLLAGGRSVASGLPRYVIDEARVRDVYGVQLEPSGALGFRLPPEAT